MYNANKYKWLNTLYSPPQKFHSTVSIITFAYPLIICLGRVLLGMRFSSISRAGVHDNGKEPGVISFPLTILISIHLVIHVLDDCGHVPEGLGTNGGNLV